MDHMDCTSEWVVQGFRPAFFTAIQTSHPPTNTTPKKTTKKDKKRGFTEAKHSKTGKKYALAVAPVQ